MNPSPETAAGREASRPTADAENVSKRYGVTVALDQVSLRVVPGEIHALVGRNGAGKSTLVSLLTGLQAPDTGTVSFDGVPAPPIADRSAWRSRVACVYQKSTVIGSLSVAENVFLHRQPRHRRGLLDWRSMRRQAHDLLATWGVDVDVRREAATLPVEQRQLVEIARALSYGSRFIILDEPTAQLDADAISDLFAKMAALKGQGVTFLFISHHLEEVYQICDRVTVLRDARHVLTAPVTDVPQAELVAAMTGEATSLIAPPPDRPPADRTAAPALHVSELTVPGSIDGLSLAVAPGEIVGLAGSGSSGKMAAAEAIVGLRTPSTGTVQIGHRRLRPGSVPDALSAGVGFVPQDRHREGLVAGLSIAENATMTVPRKLGRAGFLSNRRRDELGSEAISALDIKAAGPQQPVSDLSGGNQQKVVMARALANDPSVLVLLQPTAGVDVRAKETLLATARQAADRGAGVLIVSDDLDDLRPADRVIVLYKGHIVDEMPRGWHDHTLIAAMEGVPS